MFESLISEWETQLNKDLREQKEILQQEASELENFKSLYTTANAKNRELEESIHQLKLNEPLNISKVQKSNILSDTSLDNSLTLSLANNTKELNKKINPHKNKLENLNKTLEEFKERLYTIDEFKIKLKQVSSTLKQKIQDLTRENTFLRNRVISLTDRFYTVCRISPLKPELAKSGDFSIFSNSAQNLALEENFYNKTEICVDSKKFNFDRIIKPKSSEDEVYQLLIAPFISANFAGASVCYLTYGQTGSGKTYTMNQIFSAYISQISKFYTSAQVQMQYKAIEIYDNKQNILLTQNFIIKGEYSEIKSILDTHEKAISLRKTGCNKLNKNSSRSHTIFEICLCNEIRKSKKIFFIDLAGSEKNKFSASDKFSAKEALKINESLSHLMNLMREVKRNRIASAHGISALNRYLVNNVLESKTKIIFIGTISESFLCLKDTLNTLKFIEGLMDINLKKLDSNQIEVKGKKNEEGRVKVVDNEDRFGKILKRFDMVKKNNKVF